MGSAFVLGAVIAALACGQTDRDASDAAAGHADGGCPSQALAQCDDGIDNDGDGKQDMADPLRAQSMQSLTLFERTPESNACL